jgi:hypothetical protein
MGRHGLNMGEGVMRPIWSAAGESYGARRDGVNTRDVPVRLRISVRMHQRQDRCAQNGEDVRVEAEGEGGRGTTLP